jgi:polyisoprenoid-binding protein YceI
MKTLLLLLSIVLSFASAPALHAADHQLSAENTSIKFTGSKKDGKHEGTFKKVEGKLSLDAADVTKAKFEVIIDVESMTTDSEKLTAHLKNPDFFNAKKFPQAKFVSKSISGDKDKGYTVTGNLTMLGKTHEVTFPAKAVTADGTTTVSAEFAIKRSNWGMNYSLDKVNDEVQLALEVKLKTK